jgi:diguanylate cyclase (GGDEF)-like protein
MSYIDRLLRKEARQSRSAPCRGEAARQIAEEPQEALSRNSARGPGGWRGDAPLEEVAATRLRREQLSAVARTTPSMMLANACNALVLMFAFWGTPRQSEALCWTFGVVSLVVFLSWRHYRRAPGSKSASCPPRVLYRAIFYALVLGLCWAAAPLLFFQGSSSGTQLLIACLCAGMLCGGAFALAAIPLAAVAFTTPIVVASAFSLLRGGGPDYVLIVTVLGVYAFALLRGAFANAAQLKSRTLLQLRTEKEARTDRLTSLPNRLAFDEAMEIAFARVARSGEGFALFYADLDDFKLVNDRFGHPAGDQLLSLVAERIRERLGPNEFLARLAWDEFAILAPDIKNEEDAALLAREVNACFEAPFRIYAGEVFCAITLGAAIAPRDGDNSRSLVRSGDIALYRAKQKGSMFCLYEPRHEATAREERSLELDLRRAIQAEQFSLVFQPFLNIRDGHIVGCEALLRWRHPTRGGVSPAVFIPIAERSGFIHALGLWVVESACRAAANFPPDVRVAINVSAVQLRDPNFAEAFLAHVANAGVAPSRLEIEITETALLSEDQTSEASIRKLFGAGISLSLDDFGTGYSSLNYLRKLPLEKVKIDRSFVQDVVNQPDCAAIVRGLIAMTADLKITTIGEGVEEADQLRWLRRNGCIEAQGNFIGGPMPEREFKEFVSTWRPETAAA